ncbi:MAG: dCMP deaminase family protein [Oscillospiraceae bacterium]|jgi:dCMP deaminase|nr:dCMP deaminase family protein [Oscillospiraceae bacterium]
MRKDKTHYYLEIAGTVSSRSTCLRRQYGAIIVKNDEIVATGYNGAPRGRRNCDDMGHCLRDALEIPHGQQYELCRSVHAEANAIISASREEALGSTLYIVGRDAKTGKLLDAEPCKMCERFIINAGIENIVYTQADGSVVTRKLHDLIYDDDTISRYV